ncbi:MAG: hypothetical protein MJ181_03775 [Treponema sp.]|nr:hypothetical protein [Treponema sp.]
MLDTAMMAGCASAQKNEPEVKPAETKVILNEDGIAVFPPKSALAYVDGKDYGKLEHKTYFSKIAEKEKGINILLPPGYTTEKKYPVLYLLHGIFGDEYSMVGNPNGGNSVTIANLINQGLASEMIVVYPFMYTSKTQPQCSAIDEANVACYDNFIDEMTTSIMPFIAENYPVLEGRGNTAIYGFSMGGRESLACAFYRPDLFKFVGAVAPAPGLVEGKDFAMYHKGQFAEADVKFDESKTYPDLLMICAGDSDSVVGVFPLTYHNLFLKNEVKHIWWSIPGSDHGDPAISSGIYNFVQRIFK